MTPYKHAQFGTAFWGLLFVIGLFVAYLTQRSGGQMSTFYIMIGFFLVLGLLFGRLTVSVDSDTIEARFGIGLIGKKIDVADVADTRIEQLAWYNGLGIRLTQFGWVYVVSGKQIVVLTFEDGNTFGIGTDEPEALMRAIERAKEQWV